jgi:hypothetical protein
VSKPDSLRADVMIPAFFPEQCQSSKQWLRWFFAIMLCGSEQLMVDHGDT